MTIEGEGLPQGNVDAAIEFLKRWEPSAGWTLTAIDPDKRGAIQTQTFDKAQEKEARAWITFWQGKRNIYFSVNRPRQNLSSKADKADIGWLVALHVDIDPDKKTKPEDLGAEQARILASLKAAKPTPTVIIYSGGGYQGFWRLREALEVEPGHIEHLESYNRGLEKALAGDKCHNIDRIMRLPGTINLPNAKKRAAGRVPALAAVVEADWDRLYSIGDFTALHTAEKKESKPAQDAPPLPKSPVAEWARRVLEHGPDPEGKFAYGGDRSKAVFAVACALVRAGWTNDEIQAALLDKSNGLSAHVLDQGQPEVYALRQAQQARGKVGDDFARNEKGKIVNNQSNLRLAFSKLGVALSFNAFSRKAMIEGPDGEPRRTLDDADMTRLYLAIDGTWGYRPPKEYFNDVANNEARALQYHPVKEYLDSLRWDGEKRLDGWLHKYAKAPNSPYVRAVGSIVLIAAVRRVREPGCKFDEMVVLESQQGLDKSTGLSVLAIRDEWFTDSLPLHAEDKQVIESLGGKWIIEVAELKGMRRSDVDHLKSFLSRQVDRARMAYDRMPTEAPRQCVFFGTTNADTYLRDTTGNRRFWPVRVGPFDVAALRVDRDQLWAEAAAREAAGESIRLDPALYGGAALEQERRFIDDPWTALVDKALGGYPRGKILCADLWALINVPVGMRTQEHNARMGEVMRGLGWERLKLRFDERPQWHYFKGTEEDRHDNHLPRVCIERGPDNVLQIFEWKSGEQGEQDQDIP